MIETFVTNFLGHYSEEWYIYLSFILNNLTKYGKNQLEKFPCNLIWILYNPEGRWDGSIIYSILLVSKVLFFSHNIGLRDIGL